ncbi:MAG: hypothetical protein KDD62_11015 [Bdellovibrionales bacterium]|nr:hypothetical protein [Bdellovibrionales bacterium]
MTNSENANGQRTDLKEGDRVIQKEKPGCQGIIKMLREETVGSSGAVDNKAIMIKVLWDNGTYSYFSPDALSKAS